MEEKKLRRQNRLVLVLLALLVIAGLVIHQYFNYCLRPVAPASRQTVQVVIPKGATDHEVASLLKSHQLVKSQFVFDYYLQTHKTGGVKAGRFNLKRSATVPQLAEQLQENKAAKKR